MFSLRFLADLFRDDDDDAIRRDADLEMAVPRDDATRKRNNFWIGFSFFSRTTIYRGERIFGIEATFFTIINVFVRRTRGDVYRKSIFFQHWGD